MAQSYPIQPECVATDTSLSQYWQTRVQSMLERLEREARRMLQLESELSLFATEYYAAVGEASERLAAVEEQIGLEVTAKDLVAAMPNLHETMDACQARQREVKQRYRALAKEIHPDRTMLTQGAGPQAQQMQTLNAAYQNGDLAALLKLEAQLALSSVLEKGFADTRELEATLRDIDRATATYADSYREMLNSPLNELMLRAMSARLAGWNWIEAVVRKVERAIEEKERAAVEANIAAISEWRLQLGAA